MEPNVVSLRDELSAIDEPWRPRVVAKLNGQELKVVKVKGTFVWHQHENADEMFWVLKGHLRIELRDGEVELGPGELCVVPRGVEHRPVAKQEVELALFEPAGVVNTGDVEPSALTAPR